MALISAMTWLPRRIDDRKHENGSYQRTTRQQPRGGRSSPRSCDPEGGDGERRRRWTATNGAAEDGTDRLHGDDGLPGVFDDGEVEAGLLLLLANPTAAAATEGDDHSDGAGLLERRPEVEREGERGESDSGEIRRKGTGGRGSSHPCEAEGCDGAGRGRSRRRRDAAGGSPASAAARARRRRRYKRRLGLGLEANGRGGRGDVIYSRKRERSARERMESATD
uniref:DUF834 domain-containing protein n=1 Tax=Oryza sativa subsp. japonica TaxID=39947 RepID=Q7EYS9_ORYSJ|nr:hypothetical protein [Oryza sativa Japonica Group]